jgi:Flp pilus assembly protein TadD
MAERDENWLEAADEQEEGLPSGEVYDWYQRGVQLLDEGDPAGASQVLSRAAARVPHSRSVLEALARAQFDSEQYDQAVVSFQRLVEEDADDDYAQFGWGLSAAKLGQFDLAVEHLAVAAAMRPDVNYYTLALRGARATARAKASSALRRAEAKKS